MKRLRGRQALVGAVASMALVVVVVSGLVLTNRGNAPARGSVTYSLHATATTGSASPSATSRGTSATATPTFRGGPGQGGHRGCPYADTCTGGAGGSGGGDGEATPTVAPGGLGVTATATQTETAGGTGTPVPPFDDARAIGPTSPVTVQGAAYLTMYLTVLNTGTTTWTTDDYIECIGSCLSGYRGLITYGAVAPGQQYTFSLTVWTPAPPDDPTTYQTHWRMHRDISTDQTPFGPDIELDVTTWLDTIQMQQAAPACNNAAGTSWLWLNSGGGNSIACTGSGLTMQQGSGAVPEVILTNIAGGYQQDDSIARVHVHFSSASTSAYASLVIYDDPTNPSCWNHQLQVRPDGAWRDVETDNCNVSSYSGYVTASLDFDLKVSASPGAIMVWVDGMLKIQGGTILTSGDIGLSVTAESGSSVPVTFSSFEVDHPTPAMQQYQLAN